MTDPDRIKSSSSSDTQKENNDDILNPFSSLPKDGSGRGILARISKLSGAEARGIQPIENRTDPKFMRCFTLWFSMNLTIVAFSAGALGPSVYELSLNASIATIACVNVVSCAVPAYFATFGPKLGLRQMTQARYAYGYYPAALPAVINVVTMIGFCATNAIAGAQALVAASGSHNLSTTVGIVIISVIALIISFMGYRVLGIFEFWASPSDPAGTPTVLSYISLIAGFTLSWSPLAADFNTYMSPNVPSYKVFLSVFLGLYLACALIQMLGAAFAHAALGIPEWEEGLLANSVGGLLGAVLAPVGGFGKFLLVIFALGMTANNAPTLYSLSLNIQLIFPFLTRVPRFLFAIAATAIYLPIAIVGASRFLTFLSNFLGLLSYFSSIFCATILVEHLLIRRGQFSAYNIASWATPSELPPGFAALFAFACGVGIVVPSMDQVYWRGPFAKMISGEAEFGGDIGLELGFGVTVLVYAVARLIERNHFKR